MVALVAAFLFSLPASPKYPDRATFLRGLVALPDRASKQEIILALGKPDKIQSSYQLDGSGKKIAEETWFYGTDGPKGAATLAQFEVFDGKLAYHPVSLDPPPASMISEAELRKGMHLVLDQIELGVSPKHDPDNKNISIWVTKTVNGLLPFGEAKCKAIIGECARVSEGHAQLSPVPYFLCYSLFDPPSSSGYFDVFGPVWYAPDAKASLEHPRWPVEIIDNVPVIRGAPVGAFGGYAPSFASAYKELRDRIHLRKSPLSLPK